DPTVVRIELVEIGPDRIHPYITVGIGTPTKCVNHELIKQNAPCAIRPHHQAGIEEPETRVIVLVTAEFVPIAIDGNSSNSELNAGLDIVRSPSLLLGWLGIRTVGRRVCFLLSGISLVAVRGSFGLSPSPSPGLFLAGKYFCAA